MRWSVPIGIAATLLVGPSLLTSDAYAQQALGRDQINRISRAVVRIAALDAGTVVATGSGTIVQRDGLIYTNRHVVDDGDDFEIQVLDDLNEMPVPMYRARLVGYAMEIDFAVLQVDRDAAGRAIDAARLDLPFLARAEPDVQRGDRIYVFGYPGIGEGYLAFTEGTVTTIRNGTLSDRRMPVWYQTDAQISPGNSGGLAVNSAGQVVGIPTAVRTETSTGGRLGGVLAINAVWATLDTGLETDPARISAGTTSPVIAGGRLDYGQTPHFGSVELSAGFVPDPHSLEVVSGGEVNVDYLGGACAGHAAIAPDIRLHWSGSSTRLRILFTADDGGDTTLLVNQPDGRWICNDDANADTDTLDPMVVLADPAQGQYDIWVGSYGAGNFVQGMLHITELDLDPTTIEREGLDYSRDPYFGSVSLRAGFTPDPNTTEMIAGGPVDVAYLGEGCTGFTAVAPDFRLRWSGRSEALRIFFAADDAEDTTLVVNLPDGTWVCNDDAYRGTLDPMVVLEDPPEGQYDIWIGSYNRGTFIAGNLSITELDRQP